MDFDQMLKLSKLSFSMECPSTFVDEKTMDIAKRLGVKVLSPADLFMATKFLMPYTAGGVYNPEADLISVKNFESSAGDQSCSMLHELTHATGHTTRLNRKVLLDEFRTEADICTEEATAQMGMRKLSVELNIGADKSAAYLDWYLAKMPLADLRKAEKDAEAAFYFIMSQGHRG
jgi:antirestriction protein ArdC